MNRFGLNRSSLNGVIYALVLATASIDCAASVNAIGVRDAEALAPVSSAAYVTADAQVTRLGSAAPVGVGEFYPIPTHTHAASASAQGSAEIVAYVLRDVAASASMQGTVEIIAVVASTMGAVAVDGDADVLADATRVQAALSSAEGVCGVEISIEPTAWRMARCTAVLGVATVRAETAIELSGDGFFTNEMYAVVEAGAELTSAEVVLREVGATFACDAIATGVGTRQQPGFATALATAFIINAEPHIEAIPFAALACSANATVTATRKLIPAPVTLTCNGELTGALRQKHAASAAPTGTVTIAITGVFVTRHGGAALTGYASASATALRVLKPVAALLGTATVDVTALRTVEPSSNPIGTAEVTANGVRWLIPAAITLASTAEMTASADKLFYPASDMACAAALAATAVRVCLPSAQASGSANLYPDWRYVYIGKIAVASMSGTGALTATALRTTWVDAISLTVTAELAANASRYSPPAVVEDINGSAEVTAEASKIRFGEAALGGTAEIYADTVTNPESYDLPERTFTRTATVFEFVRPFQETEFRRTA